MLTEGDGGANVTCQKMTMCALIINTDCRRGRGAAPVGGGDSGRQGQLGVTAAVAGCSL